MLSRGAEDAGVDAIFQFSRGGEPVVLQKFFVELKIVIHVLRDQQSLVVEGFQKRFEISEDDEVSIQPGDVGYSTGKELENQHWFDMFQTGSADESMESNQDDVGGVTAEPVGKIGVLFQDAKEKRKITAMLLEGKSE